MKNFFLLSVALLISAISVQSCSSCNHRRKKEDKDSVFAKGKVIPNVSCRKDYTQSYALYLPSNYSEDKKWPVVYAFDSHGKGLLPVDLFKDEAEKYGYIIIGSNNSKNGVPWNVTSVIYDTLYNDTHRRFSIDDARTYTAGFSGGSRVASSVALIKGGINSVIGCGAGFPSLNQPPSQKFGYFGIAGNEDFNLTEMTALDTSLEKAGFRHYLQVFDGKHEWPPKSIVSDAFIWLELNAMRDKQKTTNDTLVKNTFDRWKKDYDELSGKGNSYNAYLLCKKMINYFDGLTDVSSLKTGISTLEKNAAVLQKQKHLAEISGKEMKMQSYYANAISSQSADWWKMQVETINQKIKTTPDKEEKLMHKRVLNYLSLMAYMNASGVLNAGKLDQAEKIIIIYSLVDPENPEHAYMLATLDMKKGKTQEAIMLLEKSAELGFAEPDRLENDAIMEPLKQQEKYSKILETIKNNANKKH